MITDTPLKIAFDARFYNEAGPGRYVKNILTNLENLDDTNIYYVLLRDRSFNDYKPSKGNFIKIRAEYPWYSFKEQTFFLVKLLKLHADILYVPHFNIPILYPKTIITAIPDIIMHTFSTEKGTTLPKSYFKLKKLVYRLVTMWAILRSKYVIVPSQATEHDILSVFGTENKKKVIVAPEGIDNDINSDNVISDSQTFLQKLCITSSFILCVGSMYEHKNLYRLVDAYELALKQGFNHLLVLTGKSDTFSNKLMTCVAEKNLSDKIIFAGAKKRLTDAEVNTLRSACEFYVFPSLKEGFSLTPLECMAFNKACVISDIACHKEIYKDAVLYFNPLEINDISHKLLTLSSSADLREELIAKGQKLISMYSWQKTAELTLERFNTFKKNR